MNLHALSIAFSQWLQRLSVPFVRENARLIGRFVFTILFFALGIWFLKHEKTELTQVGQILGNSRWLWLLTGFVFFLLYIFLQGLMYVLSFASIQSKIGITEAVILFLKRNFVSVFLPAGGVTSLAFFSGNLEKKGIARTRIIFASSIYGFAGILSVVILAIPAFIYSLAEGNMGKGEWYGLGAVVLLLALLLMAFQLLYRKGSLFRILARWFPAVEVFIEDMRNHKINGGALAWTIFISVLIDLVGVVHVLIAMHALQLNISIPAALMGYVVAVIFLIVSPFLRGLGAIEVSMVYVLSRFGFSPVEAMAVTLLYRFFEFWLPLLAGLFSFLLRINKLLFRIIPAMFIFCLGIINIISMLTPAIEERLNFLRGIIFPWVINTSNLFVLIAGLFLLVTSAFMLKGLRSAWWVAVFLSTVSAIGHLTKAIDYEESLVAIIVLVILYVTRKEYYVRSNPKLRTIGIQTSLLSIAAVLVYGIIGFYFLDKKHFGVDFSLVSSVKYTVLNYFMLGRGSLVAADSFARDFLYTINISGGLTLFFLLYTFIRPYVLHGGQDPEELKRAMELVKKSGRSSLDYFKTYEDKNFYFSENGDAFLAYRIAGNFAIVLEDPVSPGPEVTRRCLETFDRYCYESGMKSVYYRVPSESLSLYTSLGKKSLFIGQEGVVDLRKFSLEGGSRKPMRNALNKVKEKGYKAVFYEPPVKDGVLQKIQAVSDEWLQNTGREEIVFSQGLFKWEELKQQIILTVENPEDKIIAFLNIIPDYMPGEGTYDLIRKSNDAPNGIMDFMLLELFNYFKLKGVEAINLGFAPMSGLADPHNFPERSMKFAYEKIRSFSHYKGLREYKEKFFPEWTNKYLIYEHDYDLFQIPVALTKVIKP